MPATVEEHWSLLHTLLPGVIHSKLSSLQVLVPVLYICSNKMSQYILKESVGSLNLTIRPRSMSSSQFPGTA